MSSKSQWRVMMRQRGETRRFLVVSNREPFEHERTGMSITCRQPAGGVTAALDPLLRASGGAWIAQGTGSADADVADRYSRVMVPPDHPAYTLRRVWIPEPLRKEYYNGLANRGLWPLCHHAYQRPRFASREWDSYRRVNEMFAAAVLEEAGERPATVFVQDYHLALVPRLLKKRRPDLELAMFWHIPWPHPEILDAFPWREELLEGLLGNDVLAFQSERDAANFLSSAARQGATRVDRRRGRVSIGDRAVVVRHFPIGIDFDAHCVVAKSPKTRDAMEAWKQRIGPGVRVGIGLDRMDYTKGIPERIQALDLLFERRPELCERLVFVQVGVPSRCEVPEYRLLAQQVEEQVARVNARWSKGTWQPILFVRANLPPVEMIALHRLADFCLVTPLHDGMNLVAKEFVASREDLAGALVLSRFAGAAIELTGAILVNPFSEEQIADGIAYAMSLPAVERRQRMLRMREAVQNNDVYHWAIGLVSALRGGAGAEALAASAVRDAARDGLTEGAFVW